MACLTLSEPLMVDLQSLLKGGGVLLLFWDKVMK